MVAVTGVFLVGYDSGLSVVGDRTELLVVEALVKGSSGLLGRGSWCWEGAFVSSIFPSDARST